MGIEKATYVETQANGRMMFKAAGGELEIAYAGQDGNVIDRASLTEDDLRSLLKDNFPTKRGPKKAKAATNGSKAKSRAAEAQA